MSTVYPTAAQIRAAEAATGRLLTDGVLMARAAAGVAFAVAEYLRGGAGVYGSVVGIVVGGGDNGGDALYAGARLARRGVACRALLLDPDRAHRSGLAAFRAAGGRVVAELPDRVDVVIDGVVGIGGRGPLRPAAAAVFASVTAPVVAVDIPSGIDADTGVVHEPSVRADVTVTFGFRRRAHLLAAPNCGRVVVVDIGLSQKELEQRESIALSGLGDVEVGARWPVPGPTDDKYTQGVVGVVAGSQRYPGAAILAAGAAVAATSGMVRYVGSAAAQVVSHHPEVVAVDDVTEAGRVQAWVAGPGMGTDAKAADVLARMLADDVPVLVDADGLTILADAPEMLSHRSAPTLLTPHAGEFARLAGREASADRLGSVAALAAELGVCVLLKGRITLVADPDGQVWGNDAGSSWAATAGAGDVLSGIAGSLLAAGLPPALAGAMAARAHGHAAALAAAGGLRRVGGSAGAEPVGEAPIGASDLLAAVGSAIRLLRRSAGP